KILVTDAFAPNHFDVMRFNADGSVDTAFGNNGHADIGLLFPADMALQADGRILVSGLLDIGLANIIERLNPDGSVDTSFGAAGLAPLPVEPDVMALQPNGRILTAGRDNINQTANRNLLGRFNTNGAIDVTFGNAGTVTTPSAT